MQKPENRADIARFSTMDDESLFFTQCSGFQQLAICRIPCLVKIDTISQVTQISIFKAGAAGWDITREEVCIVVVDGAKQ